MFIKRRFWVLVSVVMIVVSVCLGLMFEGKDGDWGWYVEYSDKLPNDHPLVYLLLNGVRFVVGDANFSVLVTECIVFSFLFVMLFLVIDRLIDSVFVSSGVVVWVLMMPYVFDGTALKQGFGLGLFFLFLYWLLGERTDFDFVFDTGCLNWVRYVKLGVVYVLILFTHVVGTYLVIGLLCFYLFRGFKLSRDYWFESDFVMRGLGLTFLLMFFWVLSQQSFIYNSNKKIVYLSGFGLDDLVRNFWAVNSGVGFVFEVILLVFMLLAVIRWVKFDYLAGFCVLVTVGLLFGAVSYTNWTFVRFMGIVPLFVGLLFGRVVKVLWERS